MFISATELFGFCGVCQEVGSSMTILPWCQTWTPEVSLAHESLNSYDT